MSTPPAKLRGNYVLLRADTLRLVLPQAEVGAARYRSQGEESDTSHAALSSEMTLLPACPPGRFVVTSLEGDASGTLWCWDELQVLIDVELEPKVLPDILLSAHTPVDAYVEHDGEIAYLCSAARVAGFALGMQGVFA